MTASPVPPQIPPAPINLRDYFAMAALTGLLAHGKLPACWPEDASVSAVAYEIADAMLAARERKP